MATFYEHPLNKKKGKIQTLCVFKVELRPEWEDKVCRNGGVIIYNFGGDSKTVVPLWEALTVSLISGNIKHTDKICGIKLHEKHGKLKFEVWTTYQPKDLDTVKDLLSKHNETLEDIKKVFRNTERGIEEPELAFKAHA